MSAGIADYQFFVEWGDEGGLTLGDFEHDTGGWEGEGSIPPDVTLTPSGSSAPSDMRRLRDDFEDGPSHGDEWEFILGSVSADGGVLSVGLHEDTTDAEPFRFDESRFDEGEFADEPLRSRLVSHPRSFHDASLSARVELVDLDGSAEFSLGVYQGDENNSSEFVWDSTPGPVVHLRHTVNGDSSEITIGYDPVEMAYVRLRENSGTVVWETSHDGLIWNEHRTSSHGMATGDVRAQFASWAVSGDDPQRMEVSELNTTEHPTVSGTRSLLVRWREWNPFIFGTSMFGGGRWGAPGFENSAAVFRFDEGEFDEGRFGYAEVSEPDILSPRVERTLEGLTPDRTYHMSVFVFVPEDSPHVRLRVDGHGASDYTTVHNEWVELGVDFTLDSDTEDVLLVVEPDPDPSARTQGLFMDAIRLVGEGDTITGDVLGTRHSTEFGFGRDEARSVGAARPAETDVLVDNRTRRYSPGNPGSLLRGRLAPGRDFLIEASFEGRRWPLFRGKLSDYTIEPHIHERAVTFGFRDPIAMFSEEEVSTPLYQGVTTGQAVNRLLDEVEWPEELRDIDSGATTLRFWWAHHESVADAFQAIVDSEGPGALVYVDGGNRVVFRDRHHRILRANSMSPQAEFSPGDKEPTFSHPMTYDVGWKDIANKVSASVDLTRPTHAEHVWEDEGERIILDPGESHTVEMDLSSPVMNARKPEQGRDFTLVEGAVKVTMSRTSGQLIEVTLTASPANRAIVDDLKLWATPLDTTNSIRITRKDRDSIDKHGVREWSRDFGLASAHDVRAISEMILGRRAEQLPVVHIDVQGDRPERMREVLGRTLSDRVHIVEGETFTDDDFHIERIDHSIAEIGADVRSTFGCERVVDQLDDVFKFDDDDYGFDNGVFGLRGIDDPRNVFVLDRSSLDNDLLGF